jgi:hypothetical protein
MKARVGFSMRLLVFVLMLLLPNWAIAGENSQKAVARITIEAVPEGLRADFVLSKPTKRFEFATADIARDGNFQVTTPDIQYAAGAVTSPKAFRRFTLLVKQTEQNYDGQYAPLRPIGQGRVLQAYALHGATNQWRTQMRFVLPRDHMRTLPKDKSSTGFVYFGPKSYVKDRGSFLLITPPDFPALAEVVVTPNFEAAIANYETRLAQKLPAKPTVIAQTMVGVNGFTGDVSQSYVTYLRFSPVGWEQSDPQLASYIRGFISHEVFHFWNGGLVSSGGEATWLHEGSAEYAALLIRHGDGAESRVARNAEISSNLTRCYEGLKRQSNPPLDSLPFLDYSIRYPCGATMMWAADLRVRKISNGARTFFDVWQDIVARALRRDDRQYKIADFTELVDSQSGQQVEAIRLLREGFGDQRFAGVVAALRADGANIEMAANVDTRRASVIIHALRQDCQQVPGKSRGFSSNGIVVTLDTHEGCGVLAGSPVVTAIEGFDVAAISAANFASLQTKCAASLPLAFKLGDGRVVSVPCSAPLPDAELAYSVRG